MPVLRLDHETFIRGVQYKSRLVDAVVIVDHTMPAYAYGCLHRLMMTMATSLRIVDPIDVKDPLDVKRDYFFDDGQVSPLVGKGL